MAREFAFVTEWICAQQGAREHYAIPRALASIGALHRLITDTWVPPRSVYERIPGPLGRRLQGRYHPELAGQQVTHFTGPFLRTDLLQRIRRRPEEAFFSARNDRFDRLATRVLQRSSPASSTVVFSYCHAGRSLLAAAKSRGFRTVLGQFDPGPVEADIVHREHEARPEYRTAWKRYSPEYVALWREEVATADALVANSSWSRECLVTAGVPSGKIAVIPLVYTPRSAPGLVRESAKQFTPVRPLRVLFLGQVILRKGIARLLDAAKILRTEPVEFRLVGSTDIVNLEELSRGLPVKNFGAVPRSEVESHYREADVFLLPTLSDGYALTQLEALAAKLPLIVSRYCGEAVRHGRNGILLQEPTGEAIASALNGFLEHPESLHRLSEGATAEGFGLDRLASALTALEKSL